MKLNNVHIRSMGGEIRYIDYPAFGNIRRNVRYIPGKNGAKIKKLLGEHPFKVGIYFPYESSREFLQERIVDLQTVFHDGEDFKKVKLQFDFEDIYYFVELASNISIVRDKNIGVLELEMESADGYGHGEEKVYSNNGETTLTINNDGTAKTYPYLDITFLDAQTDLEITNGVKTLSLIYNFTAGDKVELDFKNRKVFLNGVKDMSLLDFKSRWFDLITGENTVQVSSFNTDFEVKFQERWL